MAPPEALPSPAPAPRTCRGYMFGPFRLDLASYQLSREGTPIDLTSKVFDTLLYLLSHRHRVVTKEELLAAVWRDAVVTDDSLVQCISALRRALGDDAAKPTYIVTVARRGYRFAAPATEWEEAVDPVATGGAAAPAGDAGGGPGSELVSTGVARRRHGTWAWAVALPAICLALGWYLGAWTASLGRATSEGNGTLRFAQPAPPGTSFRSGGALSPDGRRLAFAAEDAATGRSFLWVRALEAAEPRRLDGTEGASRPFWSPDSQYIAFIASGKLRTVSIDGGAATDVASVGPRPAGAAWSSNGQIIFSTWFAGFSMVSASGGTVTPLTTLGEDEVAHAWPQFLPDGDHFVFSVYNGPYNGISIGRLSTGERMHLLDADPGAIYSPLGYLVFTRNGLLTAQAFDAGTRTLSGEPFNIAAGHIEFPSMINGTMLSAAGGLLAVGGASGESELAWYDRAGQRLGTVETPVPLHNPVLSADERLVFGNTFPPAQSGVWAVDLERGATSRLVANASHPVPTLDGQRVAYASGTRILTIDLNRPTDEALEVIVQTPERKSPMQFTPDHRSLLYYSLTASGQQDLMLASLNEDRATVPLLQTTANEIQGRLSPDGRWLAYASDESGRWEVFVQAFPQATSKVTISTAGGAEPQWRADGRELYYLAEDQSLMAVEVTPGSAISFGRPRPLFRVRVVGEALTYRSHYAVTADGKRFLVDVLRDPALDPVSLLLNWANSR